jgi:tripartite-type tricarboxylate transporter receptor subunit TctC
MAKSLSTVTGRPVLVVNRSGANSNIGTASVARSLPDGHTLLLTGVGLLVSPLLSAQAGYDPIKDLLPVIKIGEAPAVLFAHESVRSLGFRGLLDSSKKLAYASAGHGQSSHIAAELLAFRTGVRWLHVPYKGTAPATRALISGEVQWMFAPVGSAQVLIASGVVEPLAVAHPRRLHALPSTPTLSELGVRDANFSQWYGFFVPTGTPEHIVAQLNKALAEATKEDEIQAYLTKQGIEPAVLNRAEFSRFIREQASKLSVLANRIGMERASD